MLYFRNDNNGAINLDGLIKIGKGTAMNPDSPSEVTWYEITFDFVDGGRYRIAYDSVEARDEEYENIRAKMVYYSQAY